MIGPGGAWVDLQQVFASHPLEPTFHSVATSRCNSGTSRIDLILASKSALPFVRQVKVLSQIRDSGHCPVMSTLQLSQSLAIEWQRPRPQLPPLLHLSSTELRASPEWSALLERWMSSPPAMNAFDPATAQDAALLSKALFDALQRLVVLAGGWSYRPQQRRCGYDSDEIRTVRRRLGLLNKLQLTLQPML